MSSSHAARLRAYQQEVARLAKAFRDAQKEMKRLAADPENPAANLGLGKFYCLWKNAWERGLPLLAKGSDFDFRSLARREAEAVGDDEQQIALGDLWLQMARTLKKTERDAALVRAGRWLAPMAARSTGLRRETLMRKLEAVSRAASSLTLASPDPARPSGLVVFDFNGRDMAVFQPISGPWKVVAGKLTRTGGDGTDHFLRSFAAANWVRVVFDFMGGKPGLYFSSSGTPAGRVGVNLDAEARYNSEIRRDVDMSR